MNAMFLLLQALLKRNQELTPSLQEQVHCIVLVLYKYSHLFKHLNSPQVCRNSCSLDCFTILDSATFKFEVKLKEAIHIKVGKPQPRSTALPCQFDTCI